MKKLAKEYSSLENYSSYLRELHERREEEKKKNKGKRRPPVPKSWRKVILLKTGGRCHVCGGEIKEGEGWATDHILSHSKGGEHSVENYLPACGICNRGRWDYLAPEVHELLKVGVWMTTQIENLGVPKPRESKATRAAVTTVAEAYLTK